MTLSSSPQQTQIVPFSRLRRSRHERAKNWRQPVFVPSPTSTDCEPRPAATSGSLSGHRGQFRVQPLAGEQPRPVAPFVNDFTGKRRQFTATTDPAPSASGRKRKNHNDSPPATSVSPVARPAFKRRNTDTLLKSLPKQTKDRLLCPFAASSVKGQTRCSGHEFFESNGDVARHLQEEHGRPPYCPHCYTLFGSEADRDSHVRLRQCQLREPRQVEGLTSKQVQELSRYVDLDEGSKETWARICLVVFSADEKHEA